ncbi:hypothetical protein ABIE27_005087 [Paenibacillus sp. 4624]
MSDELKQIISTIKQLHDVDENEIYNYIKLRIEEELINVKDPYTPT